MALSSVHFEEPAAGSGTQPLPPFAVLKEVIRGDREPADWVEARQVLTELARRKSGRLPPALLVEQVLKVTEGADWPSRRAAMDALLRRVGFAVRDELTIAERPPRRAPFGRYVLLGGSPGQGGKKRRKSKAERPYRTEIYSLEPLHASCDCADFLRSSLGLCKHLLVVLEDVASAARSSAAAARGRAELAPRPMLRWDPVRSWTGQGDRLTGLGWEVSPSHQARGRQGGSKQRIRLLHPIDAAFEAGRLKSATLTGLDRRAALLEALLAAHAEGCMAAEPAAIALARAELVVTQRRREGRAAAPQILAHTKSLRRKLYPYQREGVSRFLREQRLLLADDMGLGKTTQAIAACHALYEAGEVKRGLLIVPASLKDQWLREWQATTDRVPLELVEGRTEERAQLFRQTKQGYLVMSYEQLLRDLEPVQRFDPEMVVLDEAQRIKNWATKSSAYVMSLSPKWRLVLTGTPMENRLEELATLLDWIDDAALAPKWRLAPWHTAWKTEGRNERVGARHLDTLRQRLDPCLLRRVRRDVLSQLPPRTDARAPVEMTTQQREEHDALIVPIAQLLQAGKRRPLRQAEFLKLMQLLTRQRIISNGMALLQFEDVWPTYSRSRADDALLGNLCSPKLPELRRLISDLVLDQDRKVVVFSQWRRMLRLSEWAVRDLLEERGLRSAFFTGGESQKLRTQNIVDFHDDPSVRVMFLSDAGGVGLNLQRAASACINLELPWNPAVLEQRIGRIYRLGQEHPIDVINLVTEYGIEARIAGLVGNKRALFSGLFDGSSDAVRFDTPASFLGDIERLVEPALVPAFPRDEERGELADDDAERDVEELHRSEAASGYADADADADAESGSDAEIASAAAMGAAGEVDPPMLAPPALVVGATGLAEAREPDLSGSGGSPPSHVAALFERIAVTPTENGGLRLEAPPQAAGELAQLLEGLAALLRSAASPPRRPPA